LQEVNDKYQKMMVVGKLYSISYTQENKKDMKIINFPLMPKSNKVKCYHNTCMQTTFFPKKCVIDTCSVEALFFTAAPILSSKFSVLCAC